jgi:hypothetical protein
MWTSLRWRLGIHPCFLTLAHNFCEMATYMVRNMGCKVWAVLWLKKTECNASNNTFQNVFKCVLNLMDSTYHHAYMAISCPEKGNIM